MADDELKRLLQLWATDNQRGGGGGLLKAN